MNLTERLISDGYDPYSTDPVLFYRQGDPNGEGSNFSAHSLWLPNPFTLEPAFYKTGEHRYQAMKADSFGVHEEIRLQKTAFQAKNAGSARYAPFFTLRPGWGSNYGDLCWYVMYETVLAKLMQNSGVYEWLNNTGDRPIYEDSPIDAIWGWRRGADYSGQNLLGRCWMEVRKLL